MSNTVANASSGGVLATRGTDFAICNSKRMTKKEMRIMEKKSPNRTLAEIISDTRSGDPLLKKDSVEKG